MNTRPLRTSLPTSTRTKGDRIRYARISSDLTQDGMAKAISRITGGRLTKSLVSMWEGDSVANPTNDNLLAIQAVTGFAVNWLVNGKGPQRVTVPVAASTTTPVNHAHLARAIAAILPDVRDRDRTAKAIASLYEVIADTPDIKDELLVRFANALTRA